MSNSVESLTVREKLKACVCVNKISLESYSIWVYLVIDIFIYKIKKKGDNLVWLVAC